MARAVNHKAKGQRRLDTIVRCNKNVHVEHRVKKIQISVETWPALACFLQSSCPRGITNAYARGRIEALFVRRGNVQHEHLEFSAQIFVCDRKLIQLAYRKIHVLRSGKCYLFQVSDFLDSFATRSVYPIEECISWELLRTNFLALRDSSKKNVVTFNQPVLHQEIRKEPLDRHFSSPSSTLSSS